MHFNIADLFESVVDARPDNPALVCEQRRLSYAELDERDFCRGSISAYKAPRALVKVDQIKRTPAAKADYVWAREVAISRLGK